MSEEDFQVPKYLKKLVELKSDFPKTFKGTYGFKVTNEAGKEGFWLLDVQAGTVEFNSTKKANVTIGIKDADVPDFFTAKLDPQKAFFQGKIKITGNMGLAMAFAKLQKSMAKKLVSKL